MIDVHITAKLIYKLYKNEMQQLFTVLVWRIAKKYRQNKENIVNNNIPRPINFQQLASF